MSDLFRDWFVWSYLYLQHVFIMMYWVTIPGLLAASFISIRYRPLFQERLIRASGSGRKLLYAIGLGMASPANRQESIEKTAILIGMGISPAAALAYLIASQNLALYLLLLFTVLIGLEFGLGLFLGGLVMIFLTVISTGFMPTFLPNKCTDTASKLQAQEDLPTDWKSLLLSARGWLEAVRDIGRTFRILWLSSVVGLLLGGLILALDMYKAWPLPFWLGDEGFGPTIASAFIGPLLSSVSFSLPLGNLIVASSIWKTWTFAYAGIISFVLTSSLHPLTLRSLINLSGSRAGKYVSLVLYLSAVLGGLTVAGLVNLLGLEVTHVPWFEPLVKKIIMMLPFTMLGTGGLGLMGKMTGM